MDPMRESWTDKRLDDLNGRVDQGFERIDADIRALRVETRTEFTALRGEMKGGFGRIDERFEALHRLLVQFGGAMIVAMIGLFATLAGLIVTQL
jgi:hypothetical protein